ncbi:macro domain-containing protein [European chub iridovirus]|nr:macro domain-containing protein [European chub iridovirus]
MWKECILHYLKNKLNVFNLFFHAVVIYGKTSYKTKRNMIRYVSQNLFCSDECLAHCISQDCRMGKGIAVLFKKLFGRVQELKEQRKIVGQCAVIKDGSRYIYYLVTKKQAYERPTYETLRSSLYDMKAHLIANDVTQLSMPRIGCGLDCLQWSKVVLIIEEVFRDTNVNVTVYSLK